MSDPTQPSTPPEQKEKGGCVSLVTILVGLGMLGVGLIGGSQYII